MTFRDLTPTASPHSVAGKKGWQGELLYGQKVVWKCGELHGDKDHAEECAELALRCDDGSLMAEELIKAYEKALAEIGDTGVDKAKQKTQLKKDALAFLRWLEPKHDDSLSQEEWNTLRGLQRRIRTLYPS